MPLILEDQLQPWASAISPVEATQFLASLCHHLGDGQLSRQLYDIVLRDAPMDAGLRLGRAYAFAREGKHDHAFREADRVLHLPASEQTHFQTAEALFHSGEALRARSRGRSLRALLRLRSAVQLYATCSGTQARHGQGSALLSLSLIYRSFVLAWPVLRPVRRWILQQLRDAYALLDGPNGNALCLIAELQLDLGEIEQARATADHAAMICRWHDDHVGLANTNRALARIYLAAGDREKADDAYHAAYCESQLGHDVPGRMKAARALAGIARARGDRERDRRYLRVTWICARSLGVRNAGWRAYIDTALRVGCLDVRDRLSRLRWMA